MDRKIDLFYLILIVTLSFSCTGKKTSGKETNESEWMPISTTDSLKFTSGIRSIFQDSKGNYWFGSLQEGVAVYNGKSFRYLSSNDGLTDNQIHSIQEDKEGIIWFDTQQGVSSYDGTRIKNYAQANNRSSQNDFPIPTKELEYNSWMKSDDDLWFEAWTQEGVYRYDGQRFYYLDFPPHKRINSNDNLFAVTSISKGKNKMIWFGTYAGIFGYNGSGFTIINDETLGFAGTSESLHIRSVFEDSKGRLWIGNNGIGVLIKEGDSIINFSNKMNLIHPNSSKKGDKSPQGTLEHVFTIAEDSKGNIWFGDRDAGIWKYDGKTMENYTIKDGLTNDLALSIYEDRKGVLWFGLGDGSVCKFNGNTFERQF